MSNDSKERWAGPVFVNQSCNMCGNHFSEEVKFPDQFQEAFKKVAGPCVKCGHKGFGVVFGSGQATPLFPAPKDMKFKEVASVEE